MKYYVGDMAYDSNYLEHHGVKGQKWGVRRYQNPDGTLTEAGKKRYAKYESELNKRLGDNPYELKNLPRTWEESDKYYDEIRRSVLKDDDARLRKIDDDITDVLFDIYDDEYDKYGSTYGKNDDDYKKWKENKAAREALEKESDNIWDDAKVQAHQQYAQLKNNIFNRKKIQAGEKALAASIAEKKMKVANIREKAEELGNKRSEIVNRMATRYKLSFMDEFIKSVPKSQQDDAWLFMYLGCYEQGV